MSVALQRPAPGAEVELLVIERLAAALAKAASIDEIKDIRDRSMAVEMYARKKVGGMAAAQSAGRVVTDATMMLARLYAEEKSAKGANLPSSGCVSQHDRPGKIAIAAAAGMDHGNLSRLAPLVSADRSALTSAMNDIEARGDVVTPAGLLRQMTASSAAADYDGDEWYTPPSVIAAVRAVIEDIDLDPASNTHAQRVVKATIFFTKRDDGLSREWLGRVFCNPPYSMPLIERFAAKLIEEYDAHRCRSGIFLVNNCTDSAWFHTLLVRFPVCFTRGRIGFMNRSGQKFATRQGQAIFYAGRAKQRFAKVFSDLGAVMEPVST